MHDASACRGCSMLTSIASVSDSNSLAKIGRMHYTQI